MSAPYESQKGGGKGSSHQKGKEGQPWVEGWGDTYFSGGGKSGHGGAAAMWRQNMKGLKDFMFPQVEMAPFLSNLCRWCEQQWHIPRGEWDTHRSYLEKVKNNVAQGLGLGERF